MKILVAHDGSSYAEKALERGAEIAEKFGGQLTVVSVVPELCLPTAELSADECDKVSKAFEKETEALMKTVADSLSSKGIKADTVVETGPSVDTILATAESVGADLIILGSRGRHGVARILLGSVSSKVAENAKCDVLIVK